MYFDQIRSHELSRVKTKAGQEFLSQNLYSTRNCQFKLFFLFRRNLSWQGWDFWSVSRHGYAWNPTQPITYQWGGVWEICAEVFSASIWDLDILSPLLQVNTSTTGLWNQHRDCLILDTKKRVWEAETWKLCPHKDIVYGGHWNRDPCGSWSLWPKASQALVTHSTMICRRKISCLPTTHTSFHHVTLAILSPIYPESSQSRKPLNFLEM